MAGTVIVDAGFLIALLNRRDSHHRWAVAQSPQLPPPWRTCDAVLSEAFHLLGRLGAPALSALLRRRALVSEFSSRTELEPVLRVMRKYANVPMSFADACLVRMTEMLSEPVLLTTDSDFAVYRRHGRQVIPTIVPG
ncbi:MAG: type II toxin-antitoxin system VapC family toxin [Burkholderiaceae bacterium]